MTFSSIITIILIPLSIFGIPLLAYTVGKKVGHMLVPHRFLSWISSIISFILSTAILFTLSATLIQLFLASSVSSVLIDIIVNAILAPLMSFSIIIGFGFLIHALLQLNYKEADIEKKRKRPVVVTVLVVVGILFAPYFIWQGILNISSHNKKFAESIVLMNLKNHCPPKGIENCHELRPLPAVLQNKKIVLASSTYAEFEPYKLEYKEAANLDVDGFLSLSTYKFPGMDLVTPQSEKSGYLQDKEFKIIRAVYSYACSYCIDSSDSGYLVLENNSGYRFIAFLSDLDFSASTTKRVPWDQQVPFGKLETDWFLEPRGN